jgi:hypothetical protein
MRINLLFLFLAYANLGLCQGATAISIPQSHVSLRLPNDKWKPAPETDSSKGVYFFKREAVKDGNGRSVIPAIMLFIEDARTYHQDAVQFSLVKRLPLMNKGLAIDQTLIHTDKGYPLTYVNGLFMKASYTQNGVPHLLYMVHVIDKHEEGIQLYLDMTKDLGEQYEKEMLATVRSIREQ